MFNLTISFHLSKLGSVCGAHGDHAVCAQVSVQADSEQVIRCHPSPMHSFETRSVTEPRISSNQHSYLSIVQSPHYHIAGITNLSSHTQIFNLGVDVHAYTASAFTQ